LQYPISIFSAVIEGSWQHAARSALPDCPSLPKTSLWRHETKPDHAINGVNFFKNGGTPIAGWFIMANPI